MIKINRTIFSLLGVFCLISIFAILVNTKNPKSNFTQSSNISEQYLESFFKNAETYEESFQKFEGVKKQKVISGITSHHFLAKDLIANFFAGVDQNKIKNIIIVGPDHFKYLWFKNIMAATSTLNWKTPFGYLNANTDFVNKAAEKEMIALKDGVFYGEHSVFTLIPFIKFYFPEAKVIPIILLSSEDYDYYYKLGKYLDIPNSFLVVSSDFSHKSTLDMINHQDSKSIRALDSIDFERIDEIECDCRACIALMYGYLSNYDSVKFSLMENKNSTDFGDASVDNITSYVNAYYTSN